MGGSPFFVANHAPGFTKSPHDLEATITRGG